MDAVEVVLAMLLAVIASAYLVRAVSFPVPLPLMQIALGALIAALSDHAVTLDPAIFFLLFVPPLLFLDGWRMPNDRLLRDKAAILELAFGLVVFTVVGAGFLIHWLIPSMPLAVAFALAAILSPTDPVAVSSITSRVPMPKRLMHILQGEALLNDATGLVCFRLAVAAALTGGFSLLTASLTFLWMAIAGIGLGIGVTLAVTATQRMLSERIGEESGSPILISLLIPFGAYLLAERVHASGILAAVAAGITMSRVELSGRALAATRVQRAAVWDAVQFALNGIMFVLLGEQLPAILSGAVASVAQSGHQSPWWLAIYALAINLGLALLRFIWVWASLRLTLFKVQQHGGHLTGPHWRVVLAVSLSGVRGAITLAGVMTLPLLMPDGAAFPERDLAVFLATAVILLSLVMASIGLPPILKGLELPEESAERKDEAMARHDAAAAAIVAIEKAEREVPPQAPDTDIRTQAAARVIAQYQRRLDGSAGTGRQAARLRKVDQVERDMRMAAMHAEREEIFSLARQSRISDETSRKLVREIDLVDARYR